MKIYFGKASDKPALKHNACIQERIYKDIRSRRIAMTKMQKYWSRQGIGHFNLFTWGDVEGQPRLYFCRSWTKEELTAQGLEYDEKMFLRKVEIKDATA